MDHGKPGSDMRIDAAMGAGSVVCMMQMVEEEVGGASDLHVETSEVLPPDGGAQQQLERELEEARLKCAGEQRGKRSTPREEVTATVARVVQTRCPQQGLTVATVCATGRLRWRAMCSSKLQSQQSAFCFAAGHDSIWNIFLDLRAKQALAGKVTQEVEERRARQQSRADMDRSGGSRPATSAN